MPPPPILRVARPTDQLEAVTAFYCDGLGLEVLSSFTAHSGYDGVILGSKGAPYHLEFTREAERAAGGAPSPEHLLVFYLPEESEYRTAIDRMIKTGYDPVPSANPWWDEDGHTFEDPDGYRVVLTNRGWQK